MTRSDQEAGTKTADELRAVVENARALAGKLGLDGYDVEYWLVDHDEMNRLIAYDGFPTRYPHWRWGMKYDRQRKQDRYALARAFEIVINDDPSHAYLQESNDMADQKAVITHVEAHADFFKNNRWFRRWDDDGAVATMERHASRIAAIMNRPDVDRDEVERFVDDVLSIADTIDQHRPFEPAAAEEADDREADDDFLDSLEVSDEVRDAVFDDEWLEARAEDEASPTPASDVLAFLRVHGRQYDEETGKAVEMADWQKAVIDVLRKEAFYFAPQRMTKVTNEGWAAYWESIMMGEEAFADDAEFLQYADHQSRVLGSPGLNPYKLGKELFEYVENTANRREVVGRLLQVEGVTPRNFHDVVDLDRVRELLEPTPPLDSITRETLPDLATLDRSKVDHVALDRALSGEVDVERYPWKVLTYEGLAERHFSLTKPQHRRFLHEVGHDELERIDRYRFEDDRYGSVEAAVEDVEYTAGWEALFSVRESHNDVTFLDEFLSPEFVRANDYFTYEYSHATGDFRVTGADPEDVKKKLLLQLANFGKPTIVVEDGNYDNRNELLLVHRYNGVQLDRERAKETLKRVFSLWGRPVNLKTIVKELDERERAAAARRGEEPTPEERGLLLRYDGEDVEERELPWSEVEDIAATEVDYDTRPDDWL